MYFRRVPYMQYLQGPRGGSPLTSPAGLPVVSKTDFLDHIIIHVSEHLQNIKRI